MQSDDVRGMFDRQYLGVWDLAGRDVTVTIARVVAGELTAQGGRKSKKPVVYFEKTEKALPLNKTNMKTIAGMYGFRASDWVGKKITLFPTQTTFGSDTVEAIRVRPMVPKGRSQGVVSQPVDPAIRARQDRAAGRVNGEQAHDVDPAVAAAAIEESLGEEPAQ
jgi:hypothetical protein